VEVRPGWREDHGTARVVNIAGRTIMPGLVESHAHLQAADESHVVIGGVGLRHGRHSLVQ
jgi:imidazolonepropionase-like amidohydrolase